MTSLSVNLEQSKRLDDVFWIKHVKCLSCTKLILKIYKVLLCVKIRKNKK